MKTFLKKCIGAIGIVLVSTNVTAQIGIKIDKPKVKIDTPKIGGTDTKINLGSDESGLFKNVTDDNNAAYHRKTAVANLKTLETEYTKTSIDYDALTKLIFENERTLGHILKLEPKVNQEKYQEKYKPLKDRADKEIATYDKAKKLEDLFQKEFNAGIEFKKPDPMAFRVDSYGVQSACYCRNHKSNVKTLSEFETSKTEYEGLVKELVGYSDVETQKIFANMTTCLKNGNQYSVWASKDNVTADVVDYSVKNQLAEPKKVIERCDKYISALERIESDYSISLDTDSKKALSEGKVTVNKIKTESETYISSGKYQLYLNKIHAEKIAKVFMPKSAAKNASLETGAMTYVKGTEYNDYLKNHVSESEVASTVRAVLTTATPYVKKNEFGIPLYEYHELWVAYKGKDGKCYMAAVYASYTYKGGGTYASTPTWSGDAPEEMACENVNK